MVLLQVCKGQAYEGAVCYFVIEAWAETITVGNSPLPGFGFLASAKDEVAFLGVVQLLLEPEVSLLVAREKHHLMLFGDAADKEAHHLQEALVISFREGLVHNDGQRE